MDNKIIIFSGMPASGKDSVTNKLCIDDKKYIAFKKYRSVDDNTPRKETYYNVTEEEFKKKIKNGDFLQYHKRYDRYYGIDKNTLKVHLDAGNIPIIHIGRIENYFNFNESLQKWMIEEDFSCEIIHILLWEKLDVLCDRIKDRDKKPKDIEKRIKAANVELADNKKLLESDTNPYSYIIKNNDIEKTCRAIIEIVGKNDCFLGTGVEEFLKYVLETKNLNNEGIKNNGSSINISCKKKIENYKIKDRKFNKNVTIEDVKDNEILEFENCIFQDIHLKEIGCKEIKFVKCSIEGELRIYKGKIDNIVIRECPGISKIILEEVQLHDGNEVNLKITDSKINELKIYNTRIGLLAFCDTNSSCDSISFVRSAIVNEIQVHCSVDLLVMENLPKITLKEEGKINKIDLSNINKTVLRSFEKKTVESDRKSGTDELKRYKSIVLAMYNMFEEKKMFAESDICLFEIRRLNILIKKRKKFFGIKCLCGIEKFILEDCFGWGINIINNISTMFGVIFGFSIFYFIENARLEKGILNFWKCFEVSINRFFSIGSDEYKFLLYLDSLESILGIVLLTVITGVLVRKIIR